MTQDTKLQQLVINKLTTAQYQAALDAGTIDPNQLYMTTDSQILRDVTVGGSSIVSNNTVALGTMALETASNYSTKAVADTLYAQKALETTITTKVDKVNSVSKLYGTDSQGNQTTYNVSDLDNTVEDVRIDGVSIVASKVANFGTMAGETASNYYTKTDVYNKSEIDGKLSAGMHYKGTVASYENLPASGQVIGDLYNVTDTGANYAWNGTTWDKMSENIDLSGYVPTSRTINGKALNTNITLTAADVNALPSSTVIPTVNNASLIIQKNGTDVQTFTANASSNVTANITVPTTVAELSDSNNYALVSQLPSKATTSTAGLVKPDGTTITVDANGVISSAAGVEIDGETITQNGDNELQTVAIVNPNTNSGATSPLKIWNGTEQQWNHGEATVWNYWQTDVQAMWAVGGTLPSSSNWRSVTYGDGKFVAVAERSDKSAYSTDGINWTETTMPSKANWYSVTYSDGKFVAVAESSDKSAYSTDGINWTASTLPSSARWHSVTYGNGKFVAVAYDSTNAAYSTDGINWTASTLPSSASWRAVTYGDGKFVAVTTSGSNQSAYSTDGGETWIRGGNLPKSGYWESVTYGNGKFVTVDYYFSGKSAYSTDGGETWTASTLPNSGYWESVTYGDGKFVAVCGYSDKSAYSTDGINWTETIIPSYAGWLSVTYGDGKFIAVAYNSDATPIFTIQYDKCYTLDSTPTTSSQVYSAPEITSAKTITSIGSGTITLSNNLVYNSTPSGNQNTYRTLGDAHPDWLCNINNVGVKIGNTTIATAGGTDVEALTDSEIEELWER